MPISAACSDRLAAVAFRLPLLGRLLLEGV